MKDLKQKWLDALPVIWGIISIILCMYLLAWGIEQMIPTAEEHNLDQRAKLESLKLCTDNGLDAYQTGGGDWYCKPKGD